MKLEIITQYLNSLYPEYLKASYDNVGLMVGRLDKDVKKILLSLDLTREVMDEAIKNKVDLIITHHPILFKPLSKIDLNKDPGSIVRDLIKYDISNYALHTNFDSVKMNDYLSDLIGIKNKKVLSEKENIGVFGEIDEMPLDDFIKFSMNKFQINKSFYYGKENIVCKNVAITGGSGSSFFNDCIIKNIDLYLTGDVSYSRGLEAKRMGLNVLDIGHNIEHLYTNVIEKDLNNLDKNLVIIESKVETIPYKIYEV